MNFLTQTLIQGCVGFAVGAGTNDLAIRWIFRTIHRKKLMIGRAIQDIISSELMSPEKISLRLSTPEVRTMFERGIRDAIDRYCLVEYPSPKDFVAENPVGKDALNGSLEMLASRLADDLVYFYTTQDTRTRFVRNVFGRMHGILDPLMPDLVGMIMRMPELHARLQAEISRVLHGCSARPIGRLNRLIDPCARAYLASHCANAFAEYLGHNLPALMQQLKIWDVIQESVAGFDMKKIEGVTRRVINSELRGVTLWGGIIGLIVGISQSVVLWLIK